MTSSTRSTLRCQPFRLRTLLAVAILCVSASVVSAQDVPTVLGQDGTVFRLHQGLYSDLFEGSTEVDGDNSVLALDVRHSDGSSQRLLIPGSETDDQESSASMVFEDKTGVVYMVWETLFNGQHPLLQLTSFDGTEWSELIEITGNIFANKGAPQLMVRREVDRVIEEGEEIRRNRTTLHVTWWEEAAGISLKRHGLIVLEEGRYLGWTPVVDLSNYVLDGDVSAPPDVPGLENSLSLQAGRNHRKVVSGLVNPHTHRLITLEIEALSQVIGTIAEGIRAEIVVIGLTAGSHSVLAEMARSEVLAQGTAFHEAARQYLADQVALTIEQAEDEFTHAGVISISEKVRAEIVVIGSRIGQGGVAEPRESDIITVGQSATSGDGPYHYYQITTVSDREAPEVGGPAELLLSESGENVIVTWEEEGSVLYRESLGDSWSEPTSIELTEDLDRATVYRMLSERVRAD